MSLYYSHALPIIYNQLTLWRISITRSLFEDLIADAVGEITGRQADYFVKCELRLPQVNALSASWARNPALAGHSLDELTNTISRGTELLSRHGVTVQRVSAEADPDAISELLVASIIDANFAAQGDFALRARLPQELPLAELLCGRYSLRKSANGTCYMFSKAAGPTLLIVSATGIPITVWQGLLCDPSQHGRFLIVQSRGSPLFEGGAPGEFSLEQDVADIRDVLVSENIQDVDVLAWCNGARVGIELCRMMPDRVRSVVLVSPTFYGAADPARYPSPFEQTLPSLYVQSAADPARHRFILATLLRSTVELAELQDKPAERADLVLRQPPHEHLRRIFRPFATVDYLKNYVARAASDARYDMRAALLGLRCRVLLVTGTHDSVCNTLVARDILRSTVPTFRHVTLLGAGHHIQLLQCHYLSYILGAFTSGVTPRESARMRVECYSDTSSGERA